MTRIFDNIVVSVNILGVIMVTHDIQFSSVQFSRSVVSDSLRPHELQQARPPCPSRITIKNFMDMILGLLA